MDVREKLLVLFNIYDCKLKNNPYTDKGGKTIVFDNIYTDEEDSTVYVVFKEDSKKCELTVSIKNGEDWVNAVYERLPKEQIELLKNEQPFLFDGSIKKDTKNRQTQLLQELNTILNEEDYDSVADVVRYIDDEDELAPLSFELQNLRNKCITILKKLEDEVG